MDIKSKVGINKAYFLITLVVVLLQCSTLVNAQILGPQDTLVRNVKLTDPARKVPAREKAQTPLHSSKPC